MNLLNGAQVPDLGWEVSLAEKSVLARAAGYAAASIEGLEQGDAAFRLLETALDIYGRAVRAESEAQHEATKAYLAETAVAIEARASAAEEQVRVLTEALVDALNLRQSDRRLHPLTCPNRGDGTHTRTAVDLGALVATKDGWRCPDCNYTQPLVRASISTEGGK